MQNNTEITSTIEESKFVSDQEMPKDPEKATEEPSQPEEQGKSTTDQEMEEIKSPATPKPATQSIEELTKQILLNSD